MYKGWAIKLALEPRPLMIYCAYNFTIITQSLFMSTISKKLPHV
jgi:hypothetical protein